MSGYQNGSHLVDGLPAVKITKLSIFSDQDI